MPIIPKARGGGGGVTGSSGGVAGIGAYALWTNTTELGAGRLRQVADAVTSIIARDVNAPADNTGLAFGILSTTRGRPNTVVIGASVASSGDASAQRNVMIGSDLDPGAARANFAFNVILGSQHNLTQHDGRNVVIGTDHTRTGALFIANSVQIGSQNNISGGAAVGIGQGADVTSESVAIGQGALATGSQGVAIGRDATMGGNVNGVCIGRRARSGVDAVAIGFFCDALQANSISIGRDATDNTFANCIVIGRGAAAGVANEAVIGGGLTPFWSTRFRVGPLFSSAYPGLVVQFTHSDFSGTDVVAPPTIFRGGTNTGAATGGEMRFESPTIVASGSTRQVSAERFAVIPSTGLAASPGVRFSNVTNGAGVSSGTLANAPSAGDPSFWLPVRIGAAVRYIPCWT